MIVKTFSKKEIPEALQRVMHLNSQILVKSKELLRWREISEKAASAIYRHDFNRRLAGSRVEECIARIDAIERSIAGDVHKLLGMKAELSGVIESIGDPRFRMLLTLRYLCAMSWEEVASTMEYSYVHVVNRLHPKALLKFGEQAPDIIGEVI